MVSSAPPKIATFDLETDPFKRLRVPRAFASDFFNGRAHFTKWGDEKTVVKSVIAEIMRWDGIIYAHNGGKFDFHYLLPYLPRKRIERFLAINGRIVQIKFSAGPDLRDSYALIPRGLREWAKDDIDYSKLEFTCREHYKSEIISYLRKDTEYLHEMVEAFVGSYGLHLTLASAAFNILHKDFDVPRTNISESMDAKYRKYYFAGRVEYYGLGNLGGGYSCVDINSSFPWSMTQNHWTGVECVSHCTIPNKHLEQSFFRISAASTGAFPWRNYDGGVIFPADGVKREFFITGWEFQAARDLGLLYDCQLIQVHTPLATRNYERFISYFYKIKQRADNAGNKGERLFAKLLMNSGYGKFGMDIREFEELALCDWREPPTPNGWEVERDDQALGLTLYKRPSPPGRNKFNNVCVAASITGCSRALLMKAKERCKGVVYTDTDSLIAKDVSGIKIGDNLGEWKLEHEFDSLYIGGKKLYCGRDKNTGKWKTASKGVKLSHEEIIRVAEGFPVRYEFEAPSYSIKGSKWHRFTSRTVRRADQIKRK